MTDFVQVRGFMPLVPGQRYRIRFRLPGQRADREAVWDFLEAQWVRYERQLSFSARPQGGTQSLNADWLKAITLVGKQTPTTLGRIYRG